MNGQILQKEQLIHKVCRMVTNGMPRNDEFVDNGEQILHTHKSSTTVAATYLLASQSFMISYSIYCLENNQVSADHYIGHLERIFLNLISKLGFLQHATH